MVASCCGPGEPPPGPHMLYRVPDGDSAKEMQPTVPVCPMSLVVALLSPCTSIWIIFVPISALAYNKSDARRQLAETLHRMATSATRQLTWAFALKVGIRGGSVAWWFTWCSSRLPFSGRAFPRHNHMQPGSAPRIALLVDWTCNHGDHTILACSTRVGSMESRSPLLDTPKE